jgi:isoleucyl-tRNA synthetase
LLPLDRYMLARTRELTEKIIGPDGKTGWYGAFEFHRVYQAVNEFAIVDLSSFYLDVLKDRMYTFAPSSLARRSAQTVLWQITEALVRLVAPILTFTADEVWEQLPPVAGREASVHLARFPKPEEIFSENPAKLLEEWKTLLAIRDLALAELEGERKAQRIGKGLDADIEIRTFGNYYDILQRVMERGLKEIFNVSAVRVIKDDALSQGGGAATGFQNSDLALFVKVRALPASGSKCSRCWNFMPDTADYGIWQNVCGRCRNALHEMGIAPPTSEAAK